MAPDWVAESSTAGGAAGAGGATAGVAGGAAAELPVQPESATAQAKETTNAAAEAIGLQRVKERRVTIGQRSQRGCSTSTRHRLHVLSGRARHVGRERRGPTGVSAVRRATGPPLSAAQWRCRR